MLCNNHFDQVGTFRCVECDVYFCPDCIKRMRIGALTAYICPQCGGRCEDLQQSAQSYSEQKLDLQKKDFWLQLVQVWGYPFGNRNRATFYVGFFIYALMFFLIDIGSFGNNLNPLIVWAVCGVPLIVVYSIIFAMQVVEITVISTEEETPEWPNFFKAGDWLSRIALFFIFLCASITPAAVFYEPKELPGILVWILLLLGLYMFPIYFLAVTLKAPWAAFNPLNAFRSVLETLAPYSMMNALLFGIGLLCTTLNQVAIINTKFLGIGLRSLAVYYTLMVSMRIIGLYARAYHDRLIGFSHLQNQ